MLFNEKGLSDGGWFEQDSAGEMWSFSAPIAWSLSEALDYLNKSVAKARKKSGRFLHYVGAVKQGATICFRYTEGNYRKKGVL